MLGGLLGLYVAGYVFSIIIYFVAVMADVLRGLGL